MQTTYLFSSNRIHYVATVRILPEKVSIMVSYYNIVGILPIWLKSRDITGYWSRVAMGRWICTTLVMVLICTGTNPPDSNSDDKLNIRY